MAMMTGLAEETIRRCMDAYNERTSNWVGRFYAADADWMEMPTRALPLGRRGKRDALLAAAEAGLTAFPDRQMTILGLVAEGQHVAAELEWHGTAAAAFGPLPAGSTLRLRLASFFTVVNGLIVRQTDYCVPGGD
jgi:ketosteroid isomerase-like protein